MGYFDTDHLIAPPITAGPAPSFWQALTQGVSQQYNVDSSLGLYTEVMNRYGNSIRAYENATGKSAMPTLGSSDNTNLFAADAQGQAPSWWYRNLFTGEVSQEYQDKLKQFHAVNDWVKAQNRPDLPSMEQVLADVGQMQKGIEAETARQSQTEGVAGTVGGFVGGALGSLTPRDPLNLATLGIGGFGKTIAMRVATEAAIQAGITGVTDTTSVNPDRQLVGLPEHNTMYDMLLAAAGGAAIRGLGEGIHAGYRHFVGGTPEAPLPEIKGEGPTNEELHGVLDTLPDTPQVRAGRNLLDAVDDIERVNPYGDSLQGHERFMEELRRVQDQMNGTADTAIARFLPPLPEVPAEHIESNFDFQLVREQQPELYDRMQATRAAISDVEGRISSTEAGIAALAPSDAIARIDEPSGEIIRSYEQELQDPALTAERRADIQRKVNTIVQTLGPENVQRELTNATIKPKKELQSLRQSRKAAVRRYKDAFNAVQAEADRIKRNQDIIARAQTSKEIRAIVAGGQGRPFPPISLQAAEDISNTVRAADEVMPERMDKLVETNKNIDESEIYYHGSPEAISELRSPHELGTGKAAGIYVTKTKSVAEVYMRQRAFEKGLGTEGVLNKVRVAFKKPLIINRDTPNASELSMMALKLTKEDVTRLEAEGYDGIINNYVEGGEAVLFHSAQAKVLNLPGMVDIGLETPVPGERFFLDEGGQKVTFAKAMSDLADDDRTAEAMRTCLL